VSRWRYVTVLGREGMDLGVLVGIAYPTYLDTSWDLRGYLGMASKELW